MDNRQQIQAQAISSLILSDNWKYYEEFLKEVSHDSQLI